VPLAAPKFFTGETAVMHNPPSQMQCSYN